MGLLIERSYIHELEEKHKLEKMLCSMGQCDAHPNMFYTKIPPRVDLSDTYVMSWLAHPRDKNLNMIHDSRDLI